MEESIRLGFEGKHLIAMQGPFSKELNLAMLRALDAVFCDKRIRKIRWFSGEGTGCRRGKGCAGGSRKVV